MKQKSNLRSLSVLECQGIISKHTKLLGMGKRKGLSLKGYLGSAVGVGKVLDTELMFGK